MYTDKFLNSYLDQTELDHFDHRMINIQTLGDELVGTLTIISI